MHVKINTKLVVKLSIQDTVFTEKQLKEIYGNTVRITNSDLMYYPTNLAWNKYNKNFNGTNILDNTAEYVDNVADNVKFPIPEHITVNNVNMVMLLELYGIPGTIIKKIMKNPTVEKICCYYG